MPFDGNESDWCRLLEENIKICPTHWILLDLTDNLSRLCQQHLLTFYSWEDKKHYFVFFDVSSNISLNVICIHNMGQLCCFG